MCTFRFLFSVYTSTNSHTNLTAYNVVLYSHCGLEARGQDKVQYQHRRHD